jgi:predicted DNA-binding transcriptional regulator AlpA
MLENEDEQKTTPGTIRTENPLLPLNPNQLLSRDEVFGEFGLTRRWLELAALTGDGPPYVRISRRLVRYQRAVLEAWIAARTRTSTSQPDYK